MNSDPMERLSRANPIPGEMAALSLEPVRRRMHDEPRHTPPTGGPQRERLASGRGLAVSGAVLAGAAVALIVALVTGALTSASPAFAITRTGGSVKISLYRFEALGALNERLAAEGIPIRAVAVVPGCDATTHEVGTDQAKTPRTLQAGTSSGAARSITVVLRQRPAPGDTIIIGLARSGRAQLFPHEIKGPVPSCVAAPPAHAGNGVYYPPTPPRVLKIFPTAPRRGKAH